MQIMLPILHISINSPSAKMKTQENNSQCFIFFLFLAVLVQIKVVFSDFIRILDIFFEQNTKSEPFLHIYPYLLRKFKYAYFFKARITFSAIKKKRTTFQMSDRGFLKGVAIGKPKITGFPITEKWSQSYPQRLE